MHIDLYLIVLTEDLVRAVNGLAKGVCTLETEQLLMRLQRPLPPGPNPTRLFALRYDVEKCNSDNLLEMPGNYMMEMARLGHSEFAIMWG